jgi:hypothetical protein
MMKTKLAILTILLIASFVRPTAAEDVVAPAKGRTLLLVDDHDVLYRSGTQRVAVIPTRHSEKALIPADKEWEMLIGYTSVYRNPQTGKYQLWYQAYAGGRGGDRKLKCVVCYAESDDGITFTKPELDLFPFKGQKSNIVLVSNAGTGDRYCASVIVEPDEPDPAKRYKMAHYDWSVMNGKDIPGVQVAFSPDGIHWTKHPGTLLETPYGRYVQPPFSDEDPYVEISATDKKPAQKRLNYPPPKMSDVIDVFRDPVNKDYVINAKMWVDGPDGGGAWKNVVGQTRSKDFIHWSRPTVLIPFADDEPFAEFHGGATFFHKGRYFSLLQKMDRRFDLQDDIELAVSVDGQNWQRPFRDQLFLPRSPKGMFDSQSIWSSTPPVVLDDEIRFYYGAYNYAPRDGLKVESSQKSGIGMVRLPLDRFGGVKPVARSDQTTLVQRPLENIGQVTFKTLDLKGVTSITVNADASKGGVRVEMLNADGYRIRGFSKDDASAIQGDGLRHPVKWKDKSVGDLSAGGYMLRVHLDNAALYAITFE